MFVGTVFYNAAQWGMLMVLAKMGDPEMVGQFALGLAITAPVILFTNLHLQYVQATDAQHQYQFGDYLALRLATTTLALLIILGIVVVVDYRRVTTLVILFIGLAKAFESISDVIYGLLLQHERMDRIAKSLIIKGFGSLLALSLGVYLSGSVVWGAFGLVFAWALILVLYDIRSGVLVLLQQTPPQPLPYALAGEVYPASIIRPRWTIATLGRLAWMALPLGLVMALVSLNLNIPRYFIERYLGEWELGIFAAMAYIVIAGVTVVNTLGQAAIPRLAKYYAERNATQFSALLSKLTGIGALLGIVGVLVSVGAGQEILTLLYGSEYAEYVDIFFWLMVASGITYAASILGYGMTAARYFLVQVPLFAGIAGISTITCLWLVPIAGLKGAAIALIVAAVAQLAGSLVIVMYALRALTYKGRKEVKREIE
jgi:O-antigen/teichoic acid export membrane protein